MQDGHARIRRSKRCSACAFSRPAAAWLRLLAALGSHCSGSKTSLDLLSPMWCLAAMQASRLSETAMQDAVQTYSSLGACHGSPAE